MDDFIRETAARRAHATPGDEEHKRLLEERGLEVLRRLKGDAVWEDWLVLLAVYKQKDEDAVSELGLDNSAGYDTDKKLQRLLVSKWEAFEHRAGDNQKPLSKQERWALRFLMLHPEVNAWRATLDGFRQRKLNHPNNVINKWRSSTQVRAAPTTPRQSPAAAITERDKRIAELEARNAELSEELSSAKQAAREAAPEFQEEPRSKPEPGAFDTAIDAVIAQFLDLSSDEQAKVSARILAQDIDTAIDTIVDHCLDLDDDEQAELLDRLLSPLDLYCRPLVRVETLKWEKDSDGSYTAAVMEGLDYPYYHLAPTPDLKGFGLSFVTDDDDDAITHLVDWKKPLSLAKAKKFAADHHARAGGPAYEDSK
jgi:transposase-like protein